MPESQTSMLSLEFRLELIQRLVDRKTGQMGTDDSGVELIDVEQRGQHAGHGIERAVGPRKQRQRLIAIDPLPERTVHQGQRLQRLAQVVACGSEKTGFGQIGPFRGLRGRSQLLLGALEISDVVERDQDSLVGNAGPTDFLGGDDQGPPIASLRIDGHLDLLDVMGVILDAFEERA